MVHFPLVLTPEHDSGHGPGHETEQVNDAEFAVLASIEHVFSADQAEHEHEQIEIAVDHTEFRFDDVRCGHWGVLHAGHKVGLILQTFDEELSGESVHVDFRRLLHDLVVPDGEGDDGVVAGQHVDEEL